LGFLLLLCYRIKNIEMERFRFKTREEFEEEFGQYWQGEVRNSWGNVMDYLLGQEIPEEYTRTSRDFIFDNWSISGEMITSISNSIRKFKNGVAVVNNGLFSA
jgi:hypothetical protein